MKVSSSLAAACYAFAQSCAALEQIAFDSLLGGDTEDLAQACREDGISLRKPPYYADTPAGSSDAG